jgi:hypothetical protein
VRFERGDHAIELEVLSGEVTFRSTPNAPLVGLVADGTFRPAGSGLGVGQITFLTGNRALFLAQQGEWTLATERGSVTLRPGDTMEAQVVPESAVAPAAQESSPPPEQKKKKKKKAGLIILGAAGIGAATGIGFALGSGESGVTFPQKQNAISPVVP